MSWGLTKPAWLVGPARGAYPRAATFEPLVGPVIPQRRKERVEERPSRGQR